MESAQVKTSHLKWVCTGLSNENNFEIIFLFLLGWEILNPIKLNSVITKSF